MSDPSPRTPLWSRLSGLGWAVFVVFTTKDLIGPDEVTWSSLVAACVVAVAVYASLDRVPHGPVTHDRDARGWHYWRRVCAQVATGVVALVAFAGMSVPLLLLAGDGAVLRPAAQVVAVTVGGLVAWLFAATPHVHAWVHCPDPIRLPNGRTTR